MTALERFLLSEPPIATDRVTWAEGTIDLNVQAFHTWLIPPDDHITSVRGIVTNRSDVVVLSNPDGIHILPGGRRLPDESYAQTLRREILEETRCVMTAATYLGVVHFLHTTPKPHDYRYPYPHMFHLIYHVTTQTSDLSGADPDGYETHARYLPLAVAGGMELRNLERRFLDIVQTRLMANAH